MDSAKWLTGAGRDPFAKGNLKTVERFTGFSGTATGEQALKSWLFNRSFPFRASFHALSNYNDHPLLTTRKMIVKSSASLFCDDVTVFDDTLNWCLFFYHGDCLFLGEKNSYDPAAGTKMTEAAIKRRGYPQLEPPYY